MRATVVLKDGCRDLAPTFRFHRNHQVSLILVPRIDSSIKVVHDRSLGKLYATMMADAQKCHFILWKRSRLGLLTVQQLSEMYGANVAKHLLRVTECSTFGALLSSSVIVPAQLAASAFNFLLTG